MTAYNKFLGKLARGENILLDGAMGTELASRGFDITLPLYTAQALELKSDLVKQIHIEYIRAGVELITANSFCTAAVALRANGLDEMVDIYPEQAMILASEAVSSEGVEDDVVVAASLSPLSTYFPGGQAKEEELELAQEDHAARLALAGAELAICETMPSVKEARSALRAAVSAGLRPIISLVAYDARHLISGETLDTAVRALEPLQPSAICLNCSSLEVVNKAVSTLLALTSLPVGVYANLSTLGADYSADVNSGISTIQYLRHAQRWQEMGVKLIGGCCGSTPDHIKTLHDKLSFGPAKAETTG